MILDDRWSEEFPCGRKHAILGRMTEDQRRRLIDLRDRLQGVAARRAGETALGWHDSIARDLRQIRDDLTAAIEDIGVARDER